MGCSEVGLRWGAFPPCCQITFTLGISGVCNMVVWSLFAPPARRAYVPVFKYRLKLAKSPVLGRRAEAVAGQRAARPAPACRDAEESVRLM